MGFLFVALGGALGSVLRYTISLIPCKTDFPFITLITNFIGALAIGFVIGIVNEKSPNALLFWKTGVCGGFTTFSTFVTAQQPPHQKQRKPSAKRRGLDYAKILFFC